MNPKVTFLALLLAALAIPQTVKAYDFSATAPSGQTLYYNIVDGHAEVVPPGSNYVTGNLTIPASVSYNSSTYTVTSLGSSAFYGCTGLTSVTIPNSVTSIGSGAFYGCTGLTSVTIPNSVTSIGNNAFYNCTGLTSVTIGTSVTSIAQQAFYNCTGLTSVNVSNGNTTFDSRNGCNAIIHTSSNTLVLGCRNTVIPNSVTSIGNYAFDGCTGLTSVTIPNSVTSIGSGAFAGCTGLTSVTIPNSVTSISLRAFNGCTGLISVIIPNSVTIIESGAFYGCTGLTSVTIPNSVNLIFGEAFCGCTGLTSVTIPNSVTSIGNSAFSGVWCVFYHGTATGSPWGAYCVNGIVDTNFIYLDSSRTALVRYIGSSSAVTIPNSVISIGGNAFKDCTGLTSVTIPNSVTSIGGSAFYGCTGLTSVTIGNSVTSIGQTAFSGCSGLTEINSLASVAPQLGSNAFSGVTSTIPVNIPCGSSASYNSRWNYFSNFVEATAPTFSVQSANTAMGTVSILTQPTCQAPTAVFHAVANNGFQFSHWNDLNTDNPRSVLLTQDTSFTAYFTPAAHDTVIVHDTVTLLDTVVITHNYHDTLIINNYIYDTIYLHDTIYIHDTIFVGGEGIGDVKTIDAKIYARDGQIVVEGAEGMPVMLYDAVGRLLVARREETHGDAPLRFDVPASGVYLVKVGDWPARRIVVLR